MLEIKLKQLLHMMITAFLSISSFARLQCFETAVYEICKCSTFDPPKAGRRTQDDKESTCLLRERDRQAQTGYGRQVLLMRPVKNNLQDDKDGIFC